MNKAKKDVAVLEERLRQAELGPDPETFEDLLAEEYEPRTGRQLGNFPQAFTHVALVNTAMNLSAEAKPVEQRAEEKAA